MATTVRIPWTRDSDNVFRWNEVCAWAIEMFGLPGDRFETHANVDYMDFVFVHRYDALLMSLRWNAHVMTDEELTIDFVGSKML
jgi:hypothetical protein